MYLRWNRRFKDGKEHRYWSIVESRRCARGRVVQRQVLYLGEINDSQRAGWCDLIEAFDEEGHRHTQLALFPADEPVPAHAQAHGVQVRLDAMTLHRPRQWHVTLRARLKPLAPGLTARAVLDKLAAIQMLDVHFPTTDGRTLVLTRYTELNVDQKMLVKQLNLSLPPQPPPRLTAPTHRVPTPAM